MEIHHIHKYNTIQTKEQRRWWSLQEANIGGHGRIRVNTPIFYSYIIASLRSIKLGKRRWLFVTNHTSDQSKNFHNIAKKINIFRMAGQFRFILWALGKNRKRELLGWKTGVLKLMEERSSSSVHRLVRYACISDQGPLSHGAQRQELFGQVASGIVVVWKE